MPRGSGRAKTAAHGAPPSAAPADGAELTATEIHKRSMRAFGRLHDQVKELVDLQHEAKSSRLERLTAQVLAGAISGWPPAQLQEIDPHMLAMVGVRFALAAETELAKVEHERAQLERGGAA